jgi:MFS family permease
MEMKSKLGARNWIGISLFAALGSVAWCLENEFLNLFIDRTISTNPLVISLIVASSAITAALTTLLVGILLDRIGKRVPFIGWGYIIWGFSIMAFALIDVKGIASVFGISEKSAIGVCIAFVTLMDCVMTFFGSTANDAAFNSWVTDVTNPRNRGRVEGALGIFGFLGVSIVFMFDFLGGITYNHYYDAAGKEVSNYVEGGSVVHGDWTLFFVAVGVLVLLAGVVGKFIAKDSPSLKPNPDSRSDKILYGFKLRVVRANKKLYATLLGSSLLGIAGMTYTPYLLIYMERTLGFKDYIIPFGILSIAGVLFGFAFGVFADKKGKKLRYILPGMLVYIVGCIVMFFGTAESFAGRAIIVFCAGSMINGFGGAMMSNVFGAKIRDYTPQDRVGLFQGVRMVFNIMIPMCVGPLITACINNLNKRNIIGYDGAGNGIFNYSSSMFLFGAVAVLLVFIPLRMLMRFEAEKSTME